MVTIIIPTYKGEEKIAYAVESVLNQTYCDIEVIVVDDNGKGSDHQIATEKAIAGFSTDKRFHYITHEVNKNGSAARNTGIRASSSQYIGFLDDDDVFLPEKLEKQVALFDSLPEEYGLIYGSFREIIDATHSRVVKAEFCEDFLFEFLCDRIIACSSTVLIRRSVLDIVREWDESFRRHQDLEFFARIAFSYKVACIEDVCVEKHKLDRNVAKGEVYEQYHMHYVDKMKPIIESFSEERQKEFYNHHYIEIGKAYLKNKNFAKAMYWTEKTSKPLKYKVSYLIAAVLFIIRRFTQKNK